MYQEFAGDIVVIVSDVHLLGTEDLRGTIFCDFLEKIASSKVRYFVLNGDIFDFCFGNSQYFRNKFARIDEALQKILAKGIEVYFVQGNHEFYVHYLGWKGIKFVEELYFSLQVDSVKLAFSHGDRLYCPWHYKLYLTFVRSNLCRILTKHFPQKLFDRVCLWLSSRSRSKDPYRILPHEKILATLEAWADKSEAHHLIVGHFHYPYDQVRNRGGKILSVQSWDRPNSLTFDGEKFHRVYPTVTGQYERQSLS